MAQLCPTPIPHSYWSHRDISVSPTGVTVWNSAPLKSLDQCVRAGGGQILPMDSAVPLLDTYVTHQEPDSSLGWMATIVAHVAPLAVNL